jgi:hypothetical protein
MTTISEKKWDLTRSVSTETVTLALSGYDDFEFTGYWSKPHLCRPKRLKITWRKIDDNDWKPEIELTVRWVRKDGTVSTEEWAGKNIIVVLTQQEVWGDCLLAPAWMASVVALFKPQRA